MTTTFKPIDYDIIYLSYDEPNAERNYADLCKKVPWAKRVHGVKGSDAAHKACANLSETDRFITVDGDNIINDEFLSTEIDLTNHEDAHWNNLTDFSNCIVSWAARNTINGLIYGNGGIKCWPKDVVLNMRTHEAADPRNKQSQIEFCWDLQYIQLPTCYSTIVNNFSAKQAWRAGFREGVKLSLNRGTKFSKEEFFLNIHQRCLKMLNIWMSVGADVDNGLWAIYGARQGFYMTMFTDWDYVNVRDFDYLNTYWNDEVEHLTLEEIYSEIVNYGKAFKKELDTSFLIEPLTAEASQFCKNIYQSPQRSNSNV